MPTPTWLLQEQIATFMRLAEQATPATPTLLDDKPADLRVRLIEEELSELEAAMVCRDLVDIADALADLVYVVVGTAVAHGINLAPIFEEVHRSNMSKFIDGHRREDGKWIKGKSYSPADLRPILLNQGANL